MFNIDGFKESIFSVDSLNFEDRSIELFRFQAEKNHVFKRYIQEIGIDPGSVRNLDQIPFMPVELFKSQIIKTGELACGLR